MKNLTEDGIETVDGRPVEVYEAKIINAFEMECDDAIGISDGDLMTFIVTVRAETPKFISVKKSGILKRQNQFRVQEVKVMDSDVAKLVYDTAEIAVSGVNADLVKVSQINTNAQLGFNPEDGKL